MISVDAMPDVFGLHALVDVNGVVFGRLGDPSRDPTLKLDSNGSTMQNCSTVLGHCCFFDPLKRGNLRMKRLRYIVEMVMLVTPA